MGADDQGRKEASLSSEAISRQRLAPPESSSSNTSSGHGDSCRRENIEEDTQVSPRSESTLSITRPNEATEEIPPVQVMERTDEPGSPMPYKFPSSVFARKASSNPGEWSTASNESLFSIHMGGTGFDDANRMDVLGEPVSPDADRFDSKKPKTVVAEARSPQRESGRSPWEVPDLSPSPSSSRPSNASGASAKSFTFPILTGDDGGSSKKPVLPQGARTQASIEKTQPEMFSPRAEVPQDPKSGQEMQQPRNHLSTGGGGGWFSCFRPRRYCCGRNCS